MTHFNVLVLGAGPGGYVAAIRASQAQKIAAQPVAVPLPVAPIPSPLGEVVGE